MIGGYDAWAELREFKLVYLASPYTKYVPDHHAAYRLASEIAGNVYFRYGTNIFCPISLTHPMALWAGISHIDKCWQKLDDVYTDICEAILVAKMDGWEESTGVSHELGYFRRVGKPVYFLDIKTYEVERDECMEVQGE